MHQTMLCSTLIPHSHTLFFSEYVLSVPVQAVILCASAEKGVWFEYGRSG